MGFISLIGSEVKPTSAGVVCKEGFIYIAQYPIPNAASAIGNL